MVGPNGSGKTSLLDVLTGRLLPDAGEVSPGLNTRFGYFRQDSEDLDPTRKVLEFIKHEAGERLRLGDGTEMDAARLLEFFGFSGRMQFSPIGSLSGGERRRLYLVYVLLQNPNFLILDEPTNDLDVRTLSLLEDFLAGYDGCLLVVSHDRYFMDRVVDQLLILKEPESGDHSVASFPGSHSDLLEVRRIERSEENRAKKSEKTGKAGPDSAPVSDAPANPVKQKKAKFSFKEKREYTALLARIADLEVELETVRARLSAGGGSHQELADIGRRHHELETELEAAFARYVELGDSVENPDAE